MWVQRRESEANDQVDEEDLVDVVGAYKNGIIDKVCEATYTPCVDIDLDGT